MRGPIQIRLRGHERSGKDFFLVFAVDEGNGELAATVLLDHSGAPWFPHHLSDSGAPISPVADVAVLERAQQTVAVLEAADAWQAMRRSRRDRRRA